MSAHRFYQVVVLATRLWLLLPVLALAQSPPISQLQYSADMGANIVREALIKDGFRVAA